MKYLIAKNQLKHKYSFSYQQSIFSKARTNDEEFCFYYSNVERILKKKYISPLLESI